LNTINRNEIQFNNVNNEIQEIQFNNEIELNNNNNVNDINNNDATNIQHINPEIQLEVLNIISNSDVEGNVVIPQNENQTNQINQTIGNNPITNLEEQQFENNIQLSNEINLVNQVNQINPVECEYPSQSSINEEGNNEYVNLNTLNNINNNNLTNAINATGELEISPASIPENLLAH